MNFHYIDYMMKERQKLDREESRRRRMLSMVNTKPVDGSKIKKFWGMVLSGFTHPAAVRK